MFTSLPASPWAHRPTSCPRWSPAWDWSPSLWTSCPRALSLCGCLYDWLLGWLSGWVWFGLFFTFHFPSLSSSSSSIIVVCGFIDRTIDGNLPIFQLHFPQLTQMSADVFKFINRFLNIWFSFIYFLLLISFLFWNVAAFLARLLRCVRKPRGMMIIIINE